MNELSALSPSILAVLGFILVVQLGLQTGALVSLSRTPSSRLTIGGRKWVWVLIILLGEIIGPIIYFVAGRRPVPAMEPRVAEAEFSSSDTADVGADGTGMGELP